MENILILYCVDCKSPRVVKAGRCWSGRNRKQLYRCQDCGRLMLNPIGLKDNEPMPQPAK